MKLALRQTHPSPPTSTTMTRPGDPSISNGSGRAESAAQLVLSVGKMANLRLTGDGEEGSRLERRCLVWILANGGGAGGSAEFAHMDTADPAD